jgi:hypothetical protein
MLRSGPTVEHRTVVRRVQRRASTVWLGQAPRDPEVINEPSPGCAGSCRTTTVGRPGRRQLAGFCRVDLRSLRSRPGTDLLGDYAIRWASRPARTRHAGMHHHRPPGLQDEAGSRPPGSGSTARLRWGDQRPHEPRLRQAEVPGRRPPPPPPPDRARSAARGAGDRARAHTQAHRAVADVHLECDLHAFTLRSAT